MCINKSQMVTVNDFFPKIKHFHKKETLIFKINELLNISKNTWKYEIW